MCPKKGDWFSDIFGSWDPDEWAAKWQRDWNAGMRHGKRWRRGQVFESGEMKYVILRLLREKPRHACVVSAYPPIRPSAVRDIS